MFQSLLGWFIFNKENTSADKIIMLDIPWPNFWNTVRIFKKYFMNIVLVEGTRMLQLKVRAICNSNLANTRISEVVAKSVIWNIRCWTRVCNRHYNNMTTFNPLQPTCYVMHQQFNIQQLYFLPTLYLCVLYFSENKQRLVPLTA